ncbi:hypothetical protein Tco_1019026 [Tanacetum coccineum]|uniref:Uncharacterized protein n=1 Tax=Tanacetum coccineum TaxID=301880 RepID=A0ABQ5FVY9_9ASTR
MVCLKPLKTDEDVGLFVKALYENDSIIDLYCEHNGYDIMEKIQDQIAPKDLSVKPPFKCNADDYAHSTHENLEDLKDIVDFKVEGEENVCKRAKACSLYDHEGGLVEHYSKLWEYRQAVLESNPSSTCQLETKDRDDGKIYFKRIALRLLSKVG